MGQINQAASGTQNPPVSSQAQGASKRLSRASSRETLTGNPQTATHDFLDSSSAPQTLGNQEARATSSPMLPPPAKASGWQAQGHSQSVPSAPSAKLAPASEVHVESNTSSELVMRLKYQEPNMLDDKPMAKKPLDLRVTVRGLGTEAQNTARQLELTTSVTALLEIVTRTHPNFAKVEFLGGNPPASYAAAVVTLDNGERVQLGGLKHGKPQSKATSDELSMQLAALRDFLSNKNNTHPGFEITRAKN